MSRNARGRLMALCLFASAVFVVGLANRWGAGASSEPRAGGDRYEMSVWRARRGGDIRANQTGELTIFLQT